MREFGIEFRRGSAGGGNQMRQPYLKGIIKDKVWEDLFKKYKVVKTSYPVYYSGLFS